MRHPLAIARAALLFEPLIIVTYFSYLNLLFEFIPAERLVDDEFGCLSRSPQVELQWRIQILKINRRSIGE